jgi:hypothetical protein
MMYGMSRNLNCAMILAIQNGAQKGVLPQGAAQPIGRKN